MAESRDFFEVRGVLLDGGAALFSGSVDPSTALVDLPQGSFYLRSNGEIWKKFGSISNEWELMESVPLDVTDPVEGDLLQYNSGTGKWINVPAPSGTGDMAKSVYDTDGDGKVDLAEVAESVPWTGVTDKPSTFPPSTHTHVSTDVTDFDPAAREAVGEITFDMTGFPNRTDTSIAFDNATRTFTLAPTGASATVYYRGKAITFTTAKTFQIPDTDGPLYICMDGNGGLFNAGVTGGIRTNMLVSYIYWDATNNKAIIFGDERHSSTRDLDWHYNQHLNQGAIWRNGGGLSFTLNDDTSVSLGVGDTTIADEDLIHTITHAASPSAQYQQVLSPTALLPVMYRDGFVWREINPTTVPWVPGTSLARYNPIDGSGGSLVDATEGKYITYWVFGTNDTQYPIKLVMGQHLYDSVEEAYGDVFETYEISIAEHVPMYEVVLQVSSAFTGNTARVEIAGVRKITDRESTTSASFSATNHESLTGRSTPDAHPISSITGLQTSLDGKQATLVSGTNIKTIYGQSVLGSGDFSPQPVLTFSEVNLQTEITLNQSNTWFEVLTLTLAPGSYIVTGQILHRRQASGVETLYGRLLAGTTTISLIEATHANVNGISTPLNLSTTYTLAAQTTITMQIATSNANTNSRVRTDLSALLAGVKQATQLRAVRIG